MKYHKLPFDITLDRKYNEINADDFPKEWIENRDSQRNREIVMCNDLHIELGKFKTYDISISEMIDIGMRYALSKREFRKMAGIVIEEKKKI